LLIAAALIERQHQPLYQLATSASNPCDMRRSIELTGLAHRKHYRAQVGLEHWLRLRFDTIAVSKTRYQRLSAPGQKAIVRAIRLVASPIPLMGQSLARAERFLDRVERLIELYEPFILENEQVFESENVELLAHALPPAEHEAFGYDARAVDWWEYWINIHVPALRRWSYPLSEGRPLETRPKRSFRLDATSGRAPAAGPGIPAGATWPSS
ncbi:MAG: acyl-CoA reductase C-terminal domain-containing protein, partial [Terriglobales bacterium]